MKSLARVLKAALVTMDNDNKVSINNAPRMPIKKESNLPTDIGDVLQDDLEAPVEPTPSAIEIVEKAKEEAKEEAAAIIREAEAEAEKRISRAQQEAEQTKKAVEAKANEEARRQREESKNAGYKEGYAKAEADAQKIIDAANKMLREAEKECEKMRRDLEPEMITLILQVIEKLLQGAKTIDKQLILNLIRQGLAGATLTGDVNIRVSSEDYPQVIAQKDSLMAMADGSVRLEIIKDLSLKKLDCVIETPYGNIDCSLDQQFEALRNNFIYILETKHDG